MTTIAPIDIVQHRLPNGLRLVVSPDRVAPVVAMSLWYDVGSRHERVGRTGLGHLFEHLMFEGSTNVGSGEHMRVIQQSGGMVNDTTSTERTNYVQTVSKEQLELIMWLEADRMGGLLDAVTQESLDKQREVVKNERRQRYDNQPYGTAYERVMALLYPETHPYHHMPIGSMEDLEAASLEDVHAFFRAHYAPDNAVLTLVGDIDPDEALALATKHFGHIPAHGAIAEAPDGTLDDPLPDDIRVTLQEKVPASALFLGYRLPLAGTPDLDRLKLAMAVLNSGRASVLQRKLVRAELAQGVSTNIDSRATGASMGLVTATARPGVALDKVETVIREEIGRLADEGPSEEGLQRAKTMQERKWLERMSSLEGKADTLSYFTTVYDDPGRINERLAQILAPTAAEVQAAVAEYLVAQQPVAVEYEPITEEVAA